MRRQGQGISINVVIIAAIALLVLVILSVLVIKANGTINTGTSCGASGQGQCFMQGSWDTSSGCNEDDGFTNYPASCPKYAGEDQICCRKLSQ